MTENLLDRLSKEQIEGIFEALPIDIGFVDENECPQYWNKLETRARPAPVKVLGKDMRGCHTVGLPMMEQFVSDLKSGKKDEAAFWLLGERKLLNRFLAVRDKSGKYLGILNYILDFTAMEELAEAYKDAHKRWPSQDVAQYR